MRRVDNPIAIVCSVCGSDDVSRDAWAEWDVKAQQWVLRVVYDHSFCHRCDKDRWLEEIPLARPLT